MGLFVEGKGLGTIYRGKGGRGNRRILIVSRKNLPDPCTSLKCKSYDSPPPPLPQTMWSHLKSSKLHQCSTILDQNRQTQASFALTVGCVSIECLWATTSLPYVITSANQNKWQRLKEPIKKRKNGEATYSKRWKTQLTSAFDWLRKWREFWPITNHRKTKVIMHDNPEKLFDTY